MGKVIPFKRPVFVASRVKVNGTKETLDDLTRRVEKLKLDILDYVAIYDRFPSRKAEMRGKIDAAHVAIEQCQDYMRELKGQ